MKLGTLLTSIIVLWCLLGTVVLGPGILVYPLAWCGVAGVMFGVHKQLGLGSTSIDSSREPSQDRSPGDSDAALAR